MTAKRDLKRRVRKRQQHTGESYMTALRQVRSQRSEGGAAPAQAAAQAAAPAPGGVPVIEMIDISDIAAALGFRCGARLSPTLADRIDVASALHALRDALGATARDPAFELMHRVLLRGESPVLWRGQPRAPRGVADEARRFLARARAGIGGISEHGRMLAMSVAGRRGLEMVLFTLRLAPAQFHQLPPLLFVSSHDGVLVGPGGLTLEWR